MKIYASNNQDKISILKDFVMRDVNVWVKCISHNFNLNMPYYIRPLYLIGDILYYNRIIAHCVETPEENYLSPEECFSAMERVYHKHITEIDLVLPLYIYDNEELVELINASEF